MSFEAVRSPLFQQFFSEMHEIRRADLWALKTQIYIEFRLKQLLLRRLGDDDSSGTLSQIDTVGYHHLVLLSLAGKQYEHLRKNLMKLNNVRKMVAHKFQVDESVGTIQPLVTAVTAKPWPSTPEEQFEQTRLALAMLLWSVEAVFEDFERPDSPAELPTE